VDEVVAKRNEPAVAVESHCDVVHLLALLCGGQHVLRSFLDPPDGPAGAPREERDEHVLRVHDQLAPEPAADVRRDDPHPVERQVEHLGHDPSDVVRHLRGEPHAKLAGGRDVVRHDTARLDRHPAAAGDAVALRQGPRRLAEGALHVAARQRDSAGEVVVDPFVHGRAGG
jgi:hypothetical protein